MIDLDGEIFNRTEKPDQDILDASFSAAYDCACDRNEEILLDVEFMYLTFHKISYCGIPCKFQIALLCLYQN